METLNRMNYKELVANIFTREQEVKEINRSLSKLDRATSADATAIYYLEKARWNLCKERIQLEGEAR